MSRRKSKWEKRDKFLAKIKGQTGLDVGARIDGRVITPPSDEKVVVKTVPAVIHWKDWEASDREDDEIIGETVVYEDGSFEMVINRDISEEAKSIVNYMQSSIGNKFSLAKED